MICLNCGKDTLVRNEKHNNWICKNCGYIQTIKTSKKSARNIQKAYEIGKDLPKNWRDKPWKK